MSDPILTAQTLRKSYLSGDRRIEVLRGVDLTVAAGESVSVRGESGSGKSTLLNLLAGLDAPDALANVLMAARMLKSPGTTERARAKELLARVGLAERATHLPAQLSGGERQRVAVARALMNSPKLLLADEPTGNLDEHTGDAVIDLLLSLCSETGTALVLVTHNAAYAQKTNRQLFLHDGKLGEPRH